MSRTVDFIYKLRKYAFQKVPSLIPDPDYRRLLADCRSQDDQENARTTPPDGELIDLCSLWLIEFYAPSHVDTLLQSLDALGWNVNDALLSRDDPSSWVRQLRQGVYSGGSLNLGRIYKTGERRFLGIDRTAPLPPQVDYVTGELFGVTSSLTCIVMCFVLSEEQSHSIDQALRRSYETSLERHQHGYRIHCVSSKKRIALREIRSCARQLMTDWFRAHLPGLFSSGILDGDFPTCELMTLRLGRPLATHEEAAAQMKTYLNLLEIDHHWDAWECYNTPGLKFVWPLRDSKGMEFHAILTTREQDLSLERLQSKNMSIRDSYISYVDMQIRGLLSRWSLLAVLSAYERQLNHIRDSAKLRVDQQKQLPLLLESVGRHISQSLDITAVVDELGYTAKNKSFFNFDVADFRPLEPCHGDRKNLVLAEALRQHVLEHTSWLRNAELSLRDLLSQYGNILAATESIKLQKIVKRATWVLVFLTIVIAALTAVMAVTAA